MILLNEEEIKELLTMDECIAAVEQAFNLLGQNQFYNLPRRRIRSSRKPDSVAMILKGGASIAASKVPLKRPAAKL